MKKKILSILCTMCLILPCAIIFSACKKNKIESCTFYLFGTKIQNSTLSINFGDDFDSDFIGITLSVKTTNENLSFKLSELDYTLTYNNFSQTTTLETLPTKWDAGTYTFDCVVSTSCGNASASLVVKIAQVDYNVDFLLEVGNSTTEFTWEYDNSPVLGNDPSIEIHVGTESVNNDFKPYYLTSAQYQKYQTLSTDNEKLEYLNKNRIDYNGSYQMAPATYYLFAEVETPHNYFNEYTPFVRCVVTNAYQDYSMINLQMNYTFNPETCTGNYVTFEQIINEIGMIEFDDEFEGTVAWKEDYSAMQISYSDTPIILKLIITPSNPYITVSQTEFDVTLNLHKGLIKTPSLKDSLNFPYNEEAQGITPENAALYFDNWFSESELNLITGNFDLHTNVGEYTLTLNLADNPNFAFSEDGENSISETSIEFDWSIIKAHHHCNVNGIESTPLHAVDNETTIEATIALPASGKIALPTISKFYDTPFCAEDPAYEIVAGETTATAEIVDSEIVISTAGTIVLKISHEGNENINAIEITVIFTILD